MNEEEIQGILTPRELDHSGYPMAFSLITDEDEEIYLVNNELMDEIADYESARISVTGKLRRGSDGQLRMWAMDYEPVEDTREYELNFSRVGS